MEKSKDIPANTPSLLERIRSVIWSDPITRVGVRLTTAKNIFLIMATLYYSIYIGSVGGMFGNEGSMALTIILPAFLLSIFGLLYALLDYAIVIYTEGFVWIRYGVFGICAILYVVLTAIQLGFHSF